MIKRSLFLLQFFITSVSFSQSGEIDSSFNILDAGMGLAGFVYTISELPNNQSFLGGSFMTYQDYQVNRVVLLDSAARRIESFNSGTGPNNICYASAYRNDGRIVIGGVFTSYNGTNAQRIAVLNMDGSIDSSFACWNGADARINAIQTQVDNKIIVGGLFTNYGGASHGRIVRLTQLGQIDISFQSGTGFNGIVKTIEIQDDGKILVGGNFTSYNGVTCNYIARLNVNGTIDTSFQTGGAFDGGVISITSNSLGQIAVAGTFNNYGNTPIKKIALLDSNGNLNVNFVSGTSFSSTISQIEFDTDSTVAVATQTSGTYNGISHKTNCRLLLSGQMDSNYFASDLYQVNCLKALSNNKILFGGYFSEIYHHLRTNIVRVNPNGTPDFTFIPYGGANGTVFTIIPAPNDKLFIGGNFNNFNGRFSQRIAKLDSDGNYDFLYGTGVYAIGIYASGAIKNIKTLSSGVQYAAGDFNLTANNFNYSNLMRISPSGSPQNINYNVGYIHGLGVQSNDKLVFGGVFTFVSGNLSKKICRLNSDGTFDNTFITGNGFNNTVYCLKIDELNRIIVGGDFTNYNNSVYNRICRLLPNGIIDSSFQIGTGANGIIRHIEFRPNGKIILAGDFTQYDSHSRKKIVQLNSDGSIDTTFDAGNLIDSVNNISAISLQKDGKIIIGGDFTNVQGFPYNRIAKLDQTGILDTTFEIGTGFNGVVRSLYVKSDGTILAGGEFSKYNGYNRTRIAAIKDIYNNDHIDSIHSCSPYTWIDGITYSASNYSATHVLQNLSGGDSVVHLSFTLGAPSSSNMVITACDSFSIGGLYFNNSGVYNVIIPNSTGCDSNITLNLTIKNTVFGPSSNVIICEKYTWLQNNTTYFSSGVYFDHLIASNGCDSILSLNLTIHDNPDPIVNINSSSELAVSSIYNIFQWYDCNLVTNISNEDLQSFSPNVNGDYACIVTNSYGCTDTSDCIRYDLVGIDKYNHSEIRISPNPVKDILLVTLNNSQKARIKIINIQGDMVYMGEIIDQQFIDISYLENGIYIVEILLDNVQFSSKLVKN